jgi:hypothetical protein
MTSLKSSKNFVYVLILPLVVAGGMLFANRDKQKESIAKPILKPPTAAEKLAARKAWEATPGGRAFKEWEASPAGQKVFAAEGKIRKYLRNETGMEAVITSLSLPAGSRVGFGLMVRIGEEDYILSCGIVTSEDTYYQQLHSLKENDKIILKSRNVSHAPKYAYPIITAENIERDGKLIYKRVLPSGGVLRKKLFVFISPYLQIKFRHLIWLSSHSGSSSGSNQK